MANADAYDPNSDDGQVIKDPEDDDDDEYVKIKSEGGDQSPAPDDLLSLESLDITSVLKYGKRLLGSAGKEYEYSLAGMDPAARLQHQKKTLTSRLGLAGEYIEDDLIDDNDVLSKPTLKHDTSSMLSRQNSMQTAESTAEPTNGEEGGLSKRQLNQLKRKNKHSAKVGANKVHVVDLSSRRPSEAVSTLRPPPRTRSKQRMVTAM